MEVSLQKVTGSIQKAWSTPLGKATIVCSAIAAGFFAYQAIVYAYRQWNNGTSQPNQAELPAQVIAAKTAWKCLAENAGDADKITCILDADLGESNEAMHPASENNMELLLDTWNTAMDEEKSTDELKNWLISLQNELRDLCTRSINSFGTEQSYEFDDDQILSAKTSNKDMNINELLGSFVGAENCSEKRACQQLYVQKRLEELGAKMEGKSDDDMLEILRNEDFYGVVPCPSEDVRYPSYQELLKLTLKWVQDPVNNSRPINALRFLARVKLSLHALDSYNKTLEECFRGEGMSLEDAKRLESQCSLHRDPETVEEVNTFGKLNAYSGRVLVLNLSMLLSNTQKSTTDMELIETIRNSFVPETKEFVEDYAEKSGAELLTLLRNLEFDESAAPDEQARQAYRVQSQLSAMKYRLVDLNLQFDENGTLQEAAPSGGESSSGSTGGGAPTDYSKQPVPANAPCLKGEYNWDELPGMERNEALFEEKKKEFSGWSYSQLSTRYDELLPTEGLWRNADLMTEAEAIKVVVESRPKSGDGKKPEKTEAEQSTEGSSSSSDATALQDIRDYEIEWGNHKENQNIRRDDAAYYEKMPEEALVAAWDVLRAKINGNGTPVKRPANVLTRMLIIQEIVQKLTSNK